MPVYVVGTDGSDTAKTAAKRAGELAGATGAKLHVVSAFSGRADVVMVAGQAVEVSGLNVAEEVAAQQAATYRASGLDASHAAGEGKPGEVICAEAERAGAELIVVGNRRMQGMQRLLGAVASDVVHHAPCDVLVVKTV
jgi:nucleotide-binding universal stress UspA family protein